MKRTIIVATALLIMSLGTALAPAQADHNTRHHSGAIVVEDTVAAHPGWWEMGADVDVNPEEEDPEKIVSPDIDGEDPSMVRWVRIDGASEAYEVSIAANGNVIGGMDVFEQFSEDIRFSVTPDCPQDLVTRHLPGEEESPGAYLDRMLRLTVINHKTTLPEDTVSDEATALLPARDGGYLLAIYVRAGVQGSQLDYEVSVDTGDNLNARDLQTSKHPRTAFGLPYDTFTWVNNAGPCVQEILDEHPPPEPAASLLPDLGDEAPTLEDLFGAELGDGRALEMPSALTRMAAQGAQNQQDCILNGQTEEGSLRIGSFQSENRTVTETLLIGTVAEVLGPVLAEAQPLPALANRHIQGLDAYIIDLRCDDLVGAEISVDTEQPDLRVITPYQLGLRFYDRLGDETGPQHLEDPDQDPTDVSIPTGTQFVAIWATQCTPGVDLTPVGQVCIRFDATVIH